MGTTTVSVVIPSYNRRALTETAVRSVLAQTYADLEVVVVDDASRAEEVFTCAAIPDSRVRLVRHEANCGLAATRNTGVDAARGEVIAGLDCDDYWFPEKLANQMAIYHQLPDRHHVMIYSAYCWEQFGKWIPAPLDALRPGEALSDYLFLRQGDIHGSSWLGSRALFATFPSAVEMKRHQDWDMLLRMEAGGVRFIFCPALAGVRACDLKDDRLSTAPVREMRELFLARNLARMTPRSVVVWEAVQRGKCRPGLDPIGFLSRQLEHAGAILRNQRLGLAGRISLLFSYTACRMRNYILRQFRQIPARSR